MPHPRPMVVKPKDRPFSPAFGYKITWLAIRAPDPHAVASSLGLSNIEAHEGDQAVLVRAYREYMTKSLVMATHHGWVLVWFPRSVEAESSLRALLEPLSREFSEAHLYVNVRSSSCYGWARAVGGELLRAFYVADYKLMFDLGPPSKDEPSTEPDSLDEDDVTKMATAWSIDPMKLTSHDIKLPILLGLK